MKLTGKPGAGKPHAGFDEAGTGNGLTVPRQSSTLLDGINSAINILKTTSIIAV